MEEPKCRLCGTRHSLREPHAFEGKPKRPDVLKLRNGSAIEIIDTGDDEPYRSAVEAVKAEGQVADTKQGHGDGGKLVRHCPTCTCGGKRLYSSAAEKQKAYRQRQKGA